MVVYYLIIHWIIPFYPRYDGCFRLKRFNYLWIAAGITSAVITGNRSDSFRYILPLALNISLTDLRCMEIPDLCQFLLFLHAAAVCRSFPPVTFWLFCGGSFFCYLGWMGFADVKLICIISLLAGNGIWLILMTASAACLAVQSQKGKPASAPVPFGPYICFGLMLYLFFQ